MLSYEQIKMWLEEKDNQKLLIIGFCLVLVFLVGFGLGKFVKPNKQQTVKTYSNNSTKPALKPGAKEDLVNQKTQATSTPDTCKIKGNIGSGGKKIYHMPGGSFYNRVKEEMCFTTEAEAQAAGFVKSSR